MSTLPLFILPPGLALGDEDIDAAWAARQLGRFGHGIFAARAALVLVASPTAHADGVDFPATVDKLARGIRALDLTALLVAACAGSAAADAPRLRTGRVD